MKKWLLFTTLILASFINYASPLPAADVFQVQAKQIDPNTFTLNWQIKPGYFLYSDRIKLTEQPGSNIHLGTLRFPETLKKTDKQGRTYDIYRQQLSLPVPVLGEQPGETLVNLYFQGCSDDGFCYPPETRQIKLTIDKNLALSQVDIEVQTAQEQVETPQQPTNDIEAVFVNHHWLTVILSFFG
ncbi:protein-disulfide reductase DsbD N-terminal domain-containing protein, partial [Legionella tunisiensis]|uniref:protein-disulfide reductase DsbD N-terminal domain-containing protein n=1 Tax=Legionella tunisiensis TaxID=1034944 RepID=UPI0018DDAEEA